MIPWWFHDTITPCIHLSYSLHRPRDNGKTWLVHSFHLVTFYRSRTFRMYRYILFQNGPLESGGYAMQFISNHSQLAQLVFSSRHISFTWSILVCEYKWSAIWGILVLDWFELASRDIGAHLKGNRCHVSSSIATTQIYPVLPCFGSWIACIAVCESGDHKLWFQAYHNGCRIHGYLIYLVYYRYYRFPRVHSFISVIRNNFDAIYIAVLWTSDDANWK